MIPGAYRLICLAKFVIPKPVGLPVLKKKKVAPKEQYLRFPDIPTHAHTIVLIHIHTGKNCCNSILLLSSVHFVMCFRAIHSAGSEITTRA